MIHSQGKSEMVENSEQYLQVDGDGGNRAEWGHWEHCV